MILRLSSLRALLTITVLALVACDGAATMKAPPLTDTAAPTAVRQADIPVPTEVPTGTATPGVPLLKIPPVSCCRGQGLEAGRYAVPAWLGIPLTIEVGEGWRVLNEQAARLFLIGRGENVQNNPSQMLVFLNGTDQTTPGALIASVQQAPELTAMAEPRTIELAGFSGSQLDLTAKPNPEYEGSQAADIPPGVQVLPVLTQFFTPGFLWTTSSPEAQIRIVVLTMGDQTLLIYLEAPPHEFDHFAADATSILQSLELLDQ
jgi:hypothetical protein